MDPQPTATPVPHPFNLSIIVQQIALCGRLQLPIVCQMNRQVFRLINLLIIMAIF